MKIGGLKPMNSNKVFLGIPSMIVKKSATYHLDHNSVSRACNIFPHFSIASLSKVSGALQELSFINIMLRHEDNFASHLRCAYCT